MQNMPEDLQLPETTVSPERALIIRTVDVPGRPSFEGRVLAIGWHPGDQSVSGTQSGTGLVYLVLDRLAKKNVPFWVRSDFVEAVVESV